MDTEDKLDVSTEAAWRGLQLGMTRDAALAVMEEADEPHSTAGGDECWLATEGDWDMELRFEESGQQLLRQITWNAGDLTWKGGLISNVPFHEALQCFGSDAEGAAWSPDDAADDLFDGSGPVNTGVVADEDLLATGTLWLPKKSLGLVMCEGLVLLAVCRRESDMPPLSAGPVTAAQLNLSKQPNLANMLRKRRNSGSVSNAPSMKWTPLQWVIAAVFVLSLITLAKRGFVEMQAWQQAEVLTGTLINIEERPVKEGGDLYHVAYKDPKGQRQQVALERADFYVSPRQPGDEVQICYVAEDPPRVKGPSRAKDAAFLKYLPQFIGLLGIYVVVQMIAGFFGPRPSAPAPAVAQPAPSPFTKPVPPPSKPAQGPPGAPPGGPSAKSF